MSWLRRGAVLHCTLASEQFCSQESVIVQMLVKNPVSQMFFKMVFKYSEEEKIQKC